MDFVEYFLKIAIAVLVIVPACMIGAVSVIGYYFDKKCETSERMAQSVRDVMGFLKGRKEE